MWPDGYGSAGLAPAWSFSPTASTRLATCRRVSRCWSGPLPPPPSPPRSAARPGREGPPDAQPSIHPVDSLGVTSYHPIPGRQAAATMQRGTIRGRESADASLREMLAHLNVIDAGIDTIGPSAGPDM